jgi:hypothetical protein
VFALFRRWFPPRIADEDDPLTDEEHRVYRRWEAWELLPFFAFAPFLGFAWYLALKGAADLLHEHLHMTLGTRFLIQPISIVWWLPALFLGIVSSSVPVTWLYRLLLRDRYRRFERACDERVGFDGRLVTVWMAAVFAVGSSVWFVVGVRTFARFDGVGVEMRRPLSLRSTFHSYASIKAIEHRATFVAPNGNVVNRPYHIIVFDDGSSWSTNGGLRDPVPELDARIVEMVSRESGKPIQERP